MNAKPQGEPLRVGVAGLGTVGADVVGRLQDRHALLSRRAGRAIVVAGVCARDRTRDRGVDLAGIPWFDDPVSLARAEGIDCLVEVIGGAGDPAFGAQRAALDAGRDVVTANKALLALHGQELAQAAEGAGCVLAFEAAVAGGIPVIKALAEGLAGNEIRRVYGVLNGTCNYILTEMERHGSGYAEALAAAQALGYAEADPTLDVGGGDAAHKLALLAATAFGVRPDFEGVSTEGVQRVAAIDIEYAGSLGFRIRLLGVARLVEGRLEQRVQPCLVPAGSTLGQLNGAGNAVVLDGDAAERVELQGQGAGAGPTASAVLADLIDLARGFRRPVFGIPAAALRRAERQPREARRAAYYLRLLLDDRPGALAQTASALGDAGISIDRLSQRSHAGTEAPVLIVTHPAMRAQLDRAVAALRALDACVAEPVVIRVEEV